MMRLWLQGGEQWVMARGIWSKKDASKDKGMTSKHSCEVHICEVNVLKDSEFEELMGLRRFYSRYKSSHLARRT